MASGSPLGLALVVSALTQGLSVRRVLTPQVLDDDVLGQVLIALLPGLTRRPGDDRDVEAWVRDSLDGRYFGLTSTDQIIGRAVPLWTDEDGTGRFEWRAPTR